MFLKLHTKRIEAIILLFSWSFINALPVKAIVDPLEHLNNKVGIHITDQSDIDAARELVNSSGGDWGYSTVVLRDDQLNHDQWQALFDQFREAHLIPLVRLATHFENGVWVKPREDQIGNWVGFLNSLRWVVKNRYIILFNEPNHAKEWGGSVNPEEYTQISKRFSEELRRANEDFFILPSGLDAAAPNSSETMSSQLFLEKAVANDLQWYNTLDGWTSHSYPNPGFKGRPTDTGKMSVQGYRWELQLLKSLGVSKEFPVFITETGWAHKEGLMQDNSFLPHSLGASYLIDAFTNVWSDDQVVAVTPFILRYREAPFDHFSFETMKSNRFYQAYTNLQELPKQTGEPVQEENAEHVETFLPKKLVANTNYMLRIAMKNTGQSIWEKNTHTLQLKGLPETSKMWISEVEKTKPGEVAQFWIRFTSPSDNQLNQFQFSMAHGKNLFGTLLLHEFKTTSKNNILAQLQVLAQLLLHPTIFSLAGN